VYDANFKLIIIRHATDINNCTALRQYSTSEANMWWYEEDKHKLNVSQ